MTHGPFNEAWRPFAQAVAEACKEHVGPNVGVAVLMFEFGEGGRMNYFSTADRKDMVAALKELVANLEGRAHEAPERRQ